MESEFRIGLVETQPGEHLIYEGFIVVTSLGGVDGDDLAAFGALLEAHDVEDSQGEVEVEVQAGLTAHLPITESCVLTVA